MTSPRHEIAAADRRRFSSAARFGRGAGSRCAGCEKTIGATYTLVHDPDGGTRTFCDDDCRRFLEGELIERAARLRDLGIRR